jgi:hypothetical protein
MLSISQIVVNLNKIHKIQTPLESITTLKRVLVFKPLVGQGICRSINSHKNAM